MGTRSASLLSLRSHWVAAARGAAVGFILSLPATLVLIGAAALERDTSMMNVAFALAAASAGVGALIGHWSGVRRPIANQQVRQIVQTGRFIVAIGGFVAVKGAALLSNDGSLLYAMDSITGAPWLLLLPAALVSAALLLVPPDRDDDATTRLGAQPPLLRGRTIIGIGAVGLLAFGASNRLERERVGTSDPKFLQVLEDRVRLHPTHEPTLYQLGNTYLANGDYRKATAPLERAVALNPNDGWAQNDLGLVLGMQRQFFAAIPHLREAFRLIPDDQRPGRDLGWALRYARQPGAAESVYRAMQPRWPADAELVALAGYMHFEDGGRQDGAAEVRRGFSMNPSDLIVRLMMAKVLTTQAKFSEAIPHFEAYLAAHPNDMESLAQYAMVCALNGDNATAVRTWDRIEKAAPGVIDQFPPWRDSRDAARAQLAAGKR